MDFWLLRRNSSGLTTLETHSQVVTKIVVFRGRHSPYLSLWHCTPTLTWFSWLASGIWDPPRLNCIIYENWGWYLGGAVCFPIVIILVNEKNLRCIYTTHINGETAKENKIGVPMSIPMTSKRFEIRRSLLPLTIPRYRHWQKKTQTVLLEFLRHYSRLNYADTRTRPVGAKRLYLEAGLSILELLHWLK